MSSFAARTFATAFIGLIIARGAAAVGLDPRAIDIITLRLGMTETQVLERLGSQGSGETRQKRRSRPCKDDPARACLSELMARTKDGVLEIKFSAEATRVEQIVYRFDARQPNETQAIEESILARFGPPTQASPMTWCQVTPGTPCPRDMPRITFENGTGTTRILTLTGGRPPGA